MIRRRLRERFILHEAYFASLGKNGRRPGADLGKQLEADLGRCARGLQDRQPARPCGPLKRLRQPMSCSTSSASLKTRKVDACLPDSNYTIDQPSKSQAKGCLHLKL